MRSTHPAVLPSSARPKAVSPLRAAAVYQRSACTGFVKCAAFLVGFILLCSAHPAPAAEMTLEYQLKAAWLHNFLKYAEWPATNFAGPDSPMVIGVLGENPFGEKLAEIVKSRPVNGREVQVKRCVTVADASTCHLLFISPSEDERLPEILPALAGNAVLTVGECAEFAVAGGMIRFVLDETKLRFEINLGVTRKAGIQLNAQLLKLAAKIRN